MSLESLETVYAKISLQSLKTKCAKMLNEFEIMLKEVARLKSEAITRQIEEVEASF